MNRKINKILINKMLKDEIEKESFNKKGLKIKKNINKK
jgi:hypothetical protein